jgi:hypothetical protein
MLTKLGAKKTKKSLFMKINHLVLTTMSVLKDHIVNAPQKTDHAEAIQTGMTVLKEAIRTEMTDPRDLIPIGTIDPNAVILTETRDLAEIMPQGQINLPIVTNQLLKIALQTTDPKELTQTEMTVLKEPIQIGMTDPRELILTETTSPNAVILTVMTDLKEHTLTEMINLREHTLTEMTNLAEKALPVQTNLLIPKKLATAINPIDQVELNALILKELMLPRPVGQKSIKTQKIKKHGG